MALQTGTNQNENSEPTKIEEISGVAGATDLTDVTPKEEETTFTSAGNLFNSPIDPPTKKTSSPMREGEAAARRAVNGIDNTVGHDINNATPVASEAMGFLDSMAAHAPRDTRISRPIDQSVDFEKYKDYLTSNSFYFDGDSNLDRTRAENQSNWAQARNATFRTLLNVVPEAIKQTANAFDFEDWSKADAETGNWVSDAMTSAQESVKDVLPIYRENPGQALDVGDFAYWMETGDSLVTSIGGFALSGYALGGGVSVLSKGASGLAKIGALVADSVKNTRSFRTALGAIEARGTGEAVRGLTLNYLMNRSESLGIAAETYATVYEREYNKAIVEGKSNEEAKTTAKRFAAEGAAGSMKFNALNMILNTTSSNLFLKSAKVSSLIKKEGIGTAIGEVGKEGLEEYVNDLGQLYGEGLNTEAPLTFKAAMQRLGTAEGLESPILGFIGGAGQPALTKAGKYIQTTDNSSYVRNFNQYLLDNPITATNKEETLQKAVAYAQTQSDKDAKIGFFTNTANAGGQRTSTAQQLESLYVAQQVALSDYEKADKASNMNDVVNMSISSEFSVNLMNELSSDPTISPEQKDILLERALLSHQAYKAMSVGTMSELKDVYRTYSTMEAKEATDRGLLTDEVEGTPEHYKTKAKRALQTLDAYEANYNVSKGFVNSSEVYKSLNDIYFATRTVKEASDKYNDKAAELDTLSRELFESEGDTEALEFYESVQASNRIAIHPKLKGTKIDEEIQDERKAVKVAKQNKLNSVVNFQTITSSTYTKNLNDLVKLYKNKQIAEANKTKATKTFSEGFKNVFTSKAKTTNAKANKTKNTSTTGGSNPNTTTPPATNTASAIAKAKAANNANANKGTVTPPPAPLVKTPNTNVKNPSVFTFDTSSITASTTMQMFVDGDTKKINGILNSGDSIETKIAKLEQDVENKIKYDRVGAKNLAPDGTEVIDSLIAKIQDKISELQNELVSLSPEVRESKEAYEALVTDFGLDLEEERLLSTDIVDEDGNAIENTKAIVDSKYDIYSSILEQMKNRGVDTSNFEDVMFDFKSILGDRLTQSEFNSLQGLYNFTNNTNHNSSYKEIFGTLGEIDNDIDTANRIAKVTLPEGRFTYDLDVESQMALQAERQAIIVENPNAEVKGLAFPIYNEEGGNKIAYLAQQYSKVARQEVNKDGETYTLVDKVTTTGLLNVDLDSKTLEPDFFNVNDVITFMPLESFVNEDGETIMADTLPVSEKPVGLIINGELVQGLFLHTTSWINATNINNTSEHIEQDRLSLLALRTKIFNGESVTAKITEVSTGAPIKNPNNSSRTFLSEFATHPVGIIRNGLLETSSGIIEVPEYLSFPEGSVVIKVGDYFHYGSRVGLFAPMRQAIITGIRAFATGVESEGTKYLKQNQGLDATTSKGLEGYVRQLVNVSPVKVGESYPTNLEEFITALNTRPETEVYVNFIKGDLYIGRGQGLDVIQISQKGYAHDTRSLDVLLNEIEGLLQESYANVDLPSLKTNESIVIIDENGITRTFDTYDEYVKQVSTSIYGSIDLPSGTNITTIQKRVSFETETIDAESNPKKKRAYKKRETKKAPIVIDNPTGTQTTIDFNTTVAPDNIIDDITDDFSPDVIDASTDLSPIVEEPLVSPSLIPGLSNKLQQIVIQDIVLDYYGLLIKATKNKDKVGKLEDFYDKKVAEFDEVVLTLEKQNYAGLIKVRQQVEIIKANKAKILEIARQNLTKQLGVRVNEGNLELDNTNDSTASNDEEIDAPDGIPAEDASERSRIYDANEFGIDPKLSMSNSIRHMLYGIVDAQLGFKEEIVREVVDGVEQERVVRVASINYRKVPLQVPVYVNANEVYEDLVKLFAKSSINVGMDVEGFIPDVNSKLHPKIQVAIEILKSKYTIKPYYSNVVDKLENMDMETQLNFIRAFNKNVTDHIKVIEYLDKDGQSLSLKIIKNSTQNAVNNLKQKWNINLKAISGYVPNDDYMTLNPVIYQAFVNSYNKIKGDTDLHTYENFKNMFSVIGITLSNAAFEKLRAGVFVGGKPKNLNQQFEHTQGYFNRIKKQVDYIMNGGPNGTAIDVNLLYQDKVFTEFANFLMDFDKSVFNNSYTNGNGDTIYGVTNNRYFMERFIGLKNNLKLLKNLKNNKFSSKSAWLNNLYNENNGAINKGDFHDTFSYSTLDSYTVRETNKSKMVDTLTRVEMVKLGISLFMNKGRNILNNTIPISKFIIPALSDKTNLFVVEAQGRFYSLNNNTLLGTDLNFLRSQLFEGEFLRIIEAQAKGPIGVNGYDTGSNKFLLFPLFNDIEGLFNEGRINVDALNDPIIVARINEVIMDYIITGSTDVYNDWQAMKLLKPGKIDESTGITIYSEKMDFMDSNYAKFASKHVRQTMEEGKSLALNYHINYLVANANMQQLIFNDPAYYYKKANEEKGTTDIQETFDNATKRYAAVNGGKDDFIFPAGSTFDVLSIQDANVVSSRHDYLESLWAGHPDFVETMKSYSNMTSGDAQEYTSLEEHLDRMIYGNMISEETGKRVLKTYKETGSVSKEDLGRILIPFKPLYFNTYPGTDGIMRTLYIKTSSLPLIKELTKGTQLDALREYLDNPKTTPKVAVFESGIKAGKPTKSLALFDEKGNLDAKALKGNLNAHIITKIPREGHGNQQANPDKSLKSVVNDGTQQAKLLFTNILDVLGFKNPFAVKGEENKTISGRELATMYLNRYEDRFKKQYDKLVKELKIDANGNIGNMAKLQKLLVDEAVSRGWTFNESSSFELDDTGLNFKIPLWMSISSVKIESLLSSVVDNRIRKRKRYGRAYILASDAGVRTYNPEVDNASTGIVFTDDFTGELKNSYNDNGEMTSAEVLVPFRFYDNKGNLLKITDFMVDGKIDTNKLPKELLTGFGYRIPTSGVNLMSNIKIVGFLPESYGDVVIAPADFTVQMGSDFDVDKMYSNTYATFYDSKLGKLTRLDQSHIKQKDDITEAINLLFKEIKLYSKYKGKKKADIIKELNNQIKVLRDTEIYKIKDLDILVLDNEITDIQRAVLNNVATEVQRARTKPLSFGRLPEMIKKFGLSFDTTYYSFLNRNVQDTSYLNGNLGKTAVGNFSLDMILNSLGQYIKTPVYFQHKVKIDETRYKYVRTPIKAFGFVGNNINEPYLNDGSGRYKSDVLEGLMAAALDNGKEQILGKLGISDKTFDFIRAMVATGYNEEVIMGILAQPIMKLYLDPVTDSKVKAQMEQATRLIKKKTTFLEDTALDELTNSLYDYNIYKANLDEFGKALVKSVKDGTSESFSKTTQVAVLTMYLAMESKGQSLSQVRSSLNVDSAGVGKNIIYSTAKLEQHEKTLENPSINNVESYFVNYKYNEETDKSEKDFVSIGNSALFYAARTNAKLWGKFFPFSNKTMEKVVKTIAKRTGKDIFRLNSYSDYATLVLRDFKSFLSAANLPKALPTFMKDMSNKDIYKTIVLSSPNNQSLGEFILNLRENTSNSIKYSNDLLDGLDIDRIDNSLSTNVNPILVNIGYSNNKRIDNNEDNIVNAISEMINEPVDLGTWNGNPITSKDLANILIAYQLISRGVPGSNKFIQFIPTEQLRRLGYYESMSDNYRALLGFNSTSNSKANSAQFIMQHLQHNMADYYEPSADRTHKDSFENGVYVGENFKNMPTYIVFKEDGTYYAQHKTKTGFIRLNPLGWGPNTEYNHDVYNPVSINPDNNKSMINVTTIEVEDNSTDVTAPFVNKALGNILINSSLGKQTVIDVVTGYNENTEEDITTEMKAYPITLTENGSTVDYFLVKNGSTYNSLYHPVTQYMIPINGLTASTTKVERDIKIMESLAELNPLDVETLGLTEEVETSNIAAIEANIKEFMTPSRDKSEDVFPDDINTVTREFADELGLSDTSLNLEDKYRLIFSRIIGTVGSSNKVLSYFLSRAADIIPLLSSTPIVLDTTLKAKGMYNSNGYIVINPNKFTTIEDMANVIAHEAIHGLFKKQVKVKNPIVKDLERFRKEVEAELVVEFGQEAIDNMKAKLKMGVPLTAGVEADLLYPILNVDELITGVLTNPAFQTYLNSKEMKLAKKSLWTKVLELMSSMLRVLGVKENSKLEDSLGAIFALTNDIRDNHLNNIPNPKYQRSLAFINERFNLVSNTNTLLPKGNAQQIVDFINSNFANTTATVVEGKYVEIIPTVFLSPSTTNGDLSSDVWDLEFINDEMDNTQASTKESKGNYYTYAASLRARVIQGEHILNKAKVSQDIIAIEEATNSLMEDKVSLINIRRIQSFADFAMRAKEDYAKVSAILDGPMNSEDITYARNILNFWKDVREYSFTSKHRESEQLMRTFGIIEDEAETAVKRLELIEKNYLEDFIKDTIGKDITLDDLFATYSDIDIVSSNVRDISTYDNDLLTSIWKRVQLANMEAETESETLLKSLNTIIDKVMPKLKAINSKDPYEIFRQLSENGLKTNHLINAYSSKFYSDRSRAYTLAKNGQDFATVNNYANWIKAETKAFKLSEYFPSGGVITPEVLANREALRQEVGDFAYNMWFNGQSKKLNSYNKRKDAIIATIKADNGMELSDDITSNPKALQAITNWSKKHSPYEFSNVVNNSNYKYQDGSDGIDGFSTYEILPNKPEHFNKDFEVIANDADLLEFYNEFSSIYESLKLHVPASQFANLIFGGLPVIEQSIYQAYSTKGLKGLFKGIKTAWANSITSTITKEGATELDLVTGDNSKQMFIPGIKSNSNAIKTYVNTKAIAYEVKTGSLPSQALLAQYREEAVNELANKGDFDLGKLMKVFGTLVIAHKQIASVENLIKIGQYTLNSYKENQFNSDGSIATRSGGGNAVLPAENSFPNTKKSFTYFINSQVYGNVKDEEMVFERKKYTAEEDELKASLDKSLQELEAKYEAGEVTETFYISLKNSIVRNVDNLGKNVVGSKIGDNWLKYVQLKLMGWNILGGFSNSAFGFIGNMIEAAGEGSFTLGEMNEAYRMTASSVAKNLSFDKLKLGESGKIRNAMDKLNVLKEASHELYTSNEATSFGGKFKFASPYNMNQRTEYLNQAPLMIVMAKKTMVDTIGGRISIWDGMNADWEWDEATYGPMPTKVILDMRVAITKHIQRIHGNYDPASPLMIKKTIAGRAVSQFRTWLYEAVAVRFEKERMEHAIGTTVKGRYRTVGGLIFENEGRIGGLELTKEFSKALLNSFTFGAIKLKSFENTKLSDIDSQNMRKVAMELVLLLDVYILIALLKAGLSDDEDEAKGLYNVLLNQGTRLKSDLLLYINPIETRNILKDIIPAVSLFDDTVGFMKAVTNLEDDTIAAGVHQGNSKLGTATMKLLPGTSKFYSSYNAWSQIFDKDIKISKKDDNTEE